MCKLDTEIQIKLLEQLDSGVFLTVKKDDKLNIMTIGCSLMGRIWNKPIVMVVIRKSRYSYELLKDNTEFTISVPYKNQFSKELETCGNLSGRDFDKVSEANLTLVYKKLQTPLVKRCELFLECKIVYNSEINPTELYNKIDLNFYNNNDYHVMYLGEIIYVHEVSKKLELCIK